MRFADFVEINPSVSLRRGEEYPFVEMQAVTPGFRYIHTGGNTRIYNGGGAKFMDGDTLFARITPCLENGKIAQFASPKKSAGFGSTEFFVFRARPGISDPAYVFYLCSSDIVRKPAEKSMSGASGRQRADISSITELDVPSPPLPIQQHIASILSAYDDLIENNTRRIAILEEMARRIYEEWFVRFRFPGHEKVKMVESEFGLIPTGWSVQSVGSIADLNKLSIKRGDKIEEISYIDISSVSTGRIDNIERMKLVDAPGRARRIVRNGDIIWSNVRPNRKSFALIIDPIPNLIVSTGFTVLSPVSVPFSFLYLSTTTDDFAAYLTNRAKGAAYPAVSTEDFSEARLLLPDRAILKEFNNIIEPVLRQKHVLLLKNQNLRTTRDLLLPKLISGEIDVSHFPVSEPKSV